jgi:MFS transporter, UMF1 family
MKEFKLNDPRVINGWAMFDWANSAYFLVIATAVFPIYFTAITDDQISVFGKDISNSTVYSYAVSFAYIIIALMTPLLSGMADYGGKRKKFLVVFTWIGALSSIGLFFFSNAGLIWWGTAMFILASIGAAGGIVFYNSYLPLIVTEDRFDEVSAKGYAYGYIGSVILLAFCLLMINKPGWFGFEDAGLPTRIAFALVGVWWLGFAQIAFRRLPPDTPEWKEGILRKGIDELRSVWTKVQNQKMIMRFLASFLFYMAGVQTVIYLATIFASVELKMDTPELILVILILQIVAIVGAYLFAAISRRVGNKTSLLIQIGIWMLICAGAYLVQDKIQFYILAGFVGLVLGGIQSLSRATYAKLIPQTKNDITSYFSFYDVLMKVSLVAGAFIFGFVEQLTGSMRNSILAIMIIFAIGMIIMWTVDVSKEPTDSPAY